MRCRRLATSTGPLLIPNVAPPFNELLVRRDDPAVDTLTLGPDIFTIRFQDGTLYDINFPGAVGTPNVVLALNTAVSLLLLSDPPQFTYDSMGTIILSSGSLMSIPGSNWYDDLGMSFDYNVPFNHVYYGYPLQATTFHQVLVPTGYYSNTGLGDYVTDALDASFGDPPGTWSINPAPGAMDQRYLLQATLPFVITPRVPPSNTRDEHRYLWYQMGFFDFPPTYVQNSIQATWDPNLFGATCVYLFSNFIASANKAFDGEGAPDSVIATIPITVPYGYTQTHFFGQWNGPMLRYIASIVPRSLDVSLRNVYGDLIHLPPNQQLTVTFKLWYEQKSIHEVGGQS